MDLDENYGMNRLFAITTCFFLFSFLHCFVHGIVQSVLFSFDHDANVRVSSILGEAQVPRDQVAWLHRDDGNFTLKLCKHVPLTRVHADQCKLIFQTGMGAIYVPSEFRRRDVQDQSLRTVELKRDIQAVRNSSIIVGVELSSSVVDNGSQVFLNESCTRVLTYADQVLRNSKREELALIGSEFWLLGISVFAVMYDSIPHLLAGFFMRILSTVWSAYEIWRTHDINGRFDALITNGACGVDLFPRYFSLRVAVQIADLSLNAVALLLSAYLVWKLVKTYATCMFTRVGAPKHLIRLYRFFLGVFICLQMSVYLLVAAMSLWIDQLINGPLVNISDHNIEYLVSFTIANVLLIPWIALGWFSVRKEMRRTMLAFLLVGLFYIGGWGVLYYSQVFRWTWIQWPFFACLVVSAMIVQLASIGLGIICWRNFHCGLAQYLHADSLLTKADFEPEVFPHNPQGDPEKNGFQVDFKIITIPLSPGARSQSDAASDVDRESMSKVKSDGLQ
ncbi:hypothetical protein ACEPAG_3263 [Sanghuangporus baumii]